MFLFAALRHSSSLKFALAVTVHVASNPHVAFWSRLVEVLTLKSADGMSTDIFGNIRKPLAYFSILLPLEVRRSKDPGCVIGHLEVLWGSATCSSR